MELTYLAAPYSHDNAQVIEERIDQLCKVDAILMQRGIFTFSPLLKHFVRKYGNLPGDWEYWKNYCKASLPRCSQMYIVAIPGWQISTGVTEEMKLAELLGIPVFLVGLDGFIVTKLS
jgi:hypothetical protein